MDTIVNESIPQQLYRPEQVRDTEATAAERAGLSLWQLMERAGKAVFECLLQEFPAPVQVAVLCGKGNNGGDGYVVARLALAAGYEVSVFAAAEPTTEDARRAWELWLQAGGEVAPLEEWEESTADVVIDALLGTGITSAVREPLAEVIRDLNTRRLPVIAVDVPSGLHADSGQALGVAVIARHTVTLIGVKRGLCTGDAADYCGQLWFADLGVLREFRLLTEASAWRLEPNQLLQWLPRRAANSHKGSFGHVLIIGGCVGMAGAVRMAGEAALRSGAGKVSVICEPDQEAIVAATPELMVRGLQSNAAEAEALIEAATLIVIGPGLGQGSFGQGWWERVRELDKPLIIDADALNFLAREPLQREDWVLTPHPGEAARLLDTTTQSVQRHRWDAAETLQETYGGVVVLKGAGSIIQSAEAVAVSTYGTPAMATAGMGDLLTGIIAGICAQRAALGIDLWAATCASVLVHGLAGDSAAAGRTRGLLATDLLQELPRWLNPHDDS
ncbi:MAG: NAD(P)H-hydrate dehydratase [Idiomarina sp.]|nr:NAD(P)H-hydrate dehydratase [Idiomarina sp.]